MADHTVKSLRKEKFRNAEDIDSLEKITDVETEYPILYKHEIDPLGGINTTEERYPTIGEESDMR